VEAEGVTAAQSRRASVQAVCDRALDGVSPGFDDLALLLALPDADAAEPLFAAARELRRRHTGDAVFLYGFVYFSTYCRNRCSFCFYRKGNRESPRYRKTADEVVAICRSLAESGVNVLDLTMGEDPQVHDSGQFEALAALVAAVKQASGLPVMVSPGVVPPAALAQLSAAGADWYACYQETHTPELFESLRLGQSYAQRAGTRRAAHRAGLLVEDGILAGVGDTVADRARSLLAMRAAGDQQVRVMTLVPQRDTPFAGQPIPDPLGELLVIAAMRLLMPERLIPASLDVQGIAGLETRLQAGANVVTSIVPPASGLAGVALAERDIDEGCRTVAEVRPRLAALGLQQGSQAEYEAWMRAALNGYAQRRPAALGRTVRL
jgi:methylornithine synthase